MGTNFELWQRCKREGTPLMEGGKAVFVWFGEEAPRLMGDFNDWNDEQAYEFQPLEEENTWACEIDLPDDAYIEYIFLDGDRNRIVDPLNPRKISNGMGKTNQFFYMPGGRPTRWLLRGREAARGHLSQAVVSAPGMLAGGKRIVHFYQPPVDEPAPLVVVWDGGDYLRRAKLVNLVEALVSAGRIRPLALAMPENGGPARTMEYSCSETTIGFLLSALLPEARQRLNLLDPDENPGSFGVVGASMGGLMALYTGLRLPGIFGRVLAQSGAYDLEGYDFITGFMVDYGPCPPVKIWMDAGRFEGLLGASRRMHARLEKRGYAVKYHEYNGGHNYTAWRDELPAGLEALFGSPAAKWDENS
jgi:enterochelin esterase family protein